MRYPPSFRTAAPLRALSLIAGLTIGATACSGAGDDAGMNLLFVSLDTVRADHVGCYGYERPTTPVIDALAADGHRFDSAYTVMATTLPAHLSMFTSLFPAQTGVLANGFKVPDGVHTMAERMAAEGFRTGGFVSAIPLDESVNIGQGFDVYDSPGREPRKGGDTCAVAMDWIDAGTKSGDPFFCFVHMYDPHSWYQTDEPAFTKPFKAPLGQALPPERGFLNNPLNRATRSKSIDAYDAGIRYADAQVGKLLKFLEDRNLRENTIVIVISDHGETLDELYKTERYAFDHGEFLSRRELRIPLVIWLPGSYAERGPAVHDSLVNVLDVMPTVLDLLGLPCALPFSGRSLTNLMDAQPLPARLHFSQRRSLERGDQKHLSGQELSVTDGRWHWVRSDARKSKLFDTRSDPNEAENVITEFPDQVSSMKTSLQNWIQVMSTSFWESDGELSPEDAAALRGLGYLGGEKDE
ncbi:MAG: arylsulfatase A-like enzyme [Chlamydiales bacterium]|jgi:arylsulfatase A-like enzyme